MSGWIKMGTGLGSHPKVKTLRRALKADRLRVIGGLWAVWCVFDEHSAGGRLDGYTLDDMDDEIGWRGFAAAMQDIGWLIDDGDGLEAPDYEEHNGPSAKRRALDSSRKGRSRAKGSADEPDEDPPPERTTVRTKTGHVSASDADNLRNREEKRREEEKENPPIPPKGATSAKPTGPSPSIPCPYAAIVERYHERLPMLPRVKLMSDARQKALRKLWGWVLSSTKSDGQRRASSAEEALAWIDGYFARAAENDFLTGRTPRTGEHANWQCDIDFLLTDRGMKQVIEKTAGRAA